MERSGLLDRFEVMARPLLPHPRPSLYRWSPGVPAPDCDRLAWVCEARGRQAPVPTTVYVASEKARRVFGGRTAPRLDEQLSHDLNCAVLYVKVLRELPRLAPFFVGEDVRKPHLALYEKLPDIVFEDEEGEPWLAWEFCGLYPNWKFEQLHESLSAIPIPYVLW
jgi:hypothetical protein